MGGELRGIARERKHLALGGAIEMLKEAVGRAEEL